MMLPVDDNIALEGEGRRTVRLEANAPKEAVFRISYPDGEARFLASFRGIETIEFIADGPVEVWVECDEPVYFYTDDGRKLAYVNDGQISFTKVHSRRTESEQVIHMQRLQMANMERNQARLAALLEAEQARKAADAQSGEQAAPEGENDGGDGAGGVDGGTGEASGASAPDTAAT